MFSVRIGLIVAFVGCLAALWVIPDPWSKGFLIGLTPSTRQYVARRPASLKTTRAPGPPKTPSTDGLRRIHRISRGRVPAKNYSREVPAVARPWGD